MSLKEGLAVHREIFGLRGVCGVLGKRLFGWPQELTVRPKGSHAPVHLRLRTTDLSTYRDIFLRQEYEFDLPFRPETIVDAGANIGIASIFFAQKYPGARIVAIEPEQSNFELLTRNVRPYPQIEPVHAALWNRNGTVSIAEPATGTGARGKWGFRVQDRTGGDVRAVTMSSLLEQLSISKVDIAKIDIEGAEKEVFEDTRWLDNVRCLMIELHDRFRPGCTAAVEPAMGRFASAQKGETVFYLHKDLASITDASTLQLST